MFSDDRGDRVDQNTIFSRLEREAKYALNSHSRNLVYQTFGAAGMAHALGAITHQQFKHISDMLLRYWLNDPANSRLT